MMPKFLDAIAAQKAWYKGTGSSDVIAVERVIDQKSGAYSTTQALTTHIQASPYKPVTHDAGYDAFVAMFSESSTITVAYVTCMAK